MPFSVTMANWGWKLGALYRSPVFLTEGKIVQSPKEPICIYIIRGGIKALKTGTLTPYLPRAGLVFPHFTLRDLDVALDDAFFKRMAENTVEQEHFAT